MKKLMTLLFILPALAVADHEHGTEFGGPELRRAQIAATTLETTIKKIDEAAMAAADEEARVAHFEHIAEFDRISDAASVLQRDLHRMIIRGLIAGHDGEEIADELEKLSRQFALLKREISGSTGLPPQLSRAVSGLERDWTDLERSLVPRSPLAATCVGRYGGNFFNKKSHVECNIIGGNPTHYEVEFSNPGLRLSEKISGKIEGNSFSSAKDGKASVGRDASFVVYLFNRRGQRVEVASGTCTGNPF